MKKLIGLLIVFAALLSSADAQQIYLKNNQFYGEYTTATTQTAAVEATVDTYVGKNFLYYYDIICDVDSAGDGTDITIVVKGSNDEANWYSVGSSQSFGCTQTDTIMRFTNIPSSYVLASAADTSASGEVLTWTLTTQYAVGWKYLRMSFTGDGAGADCSVAGVYVAIRKDD